MSIYSKQAKLVSPSTIFYLNLLNHEFETHGGMCLSVSRYILKTTVICCDCSREVFLVV